MSKEIKAYILACLLVIAVAGNVWLGWSIVQTKIGLAYYEGIRNVNFVLDCYNREPSAWELVKLRNTNLQSCADVKAFIGKPDPYLADSYLPQEGE